eukprot:PhM_4_TR17072/c1_g1_i1/m.87211
MWSSRRIEHHSPKGHVCVATEGGNVVAAGVFFLLIASATFTPPVVGAAVAVVLFLIMSTMLVVDLGVLPSTAAAFSKKRVTLADTVGESVVVVVVSFVWLAGVPTLVTDAVVFLKKSVTLPSRPELVDRVAGNKLVTRISPPGESDALKRTPASSPTPAASGVRLADGSTRGETSRAIMGEEASEGVSVVWPPPILMPRSFAAFVLLLVVVVVVVVVVVAVEPDDGGCSRFKIAVGLLTVGAVWGVTVASLVGVMTSRAARFRMHPRLVCRRPCRVLQPSWGSSMTTSACLPSPRMRIMVPRAPSGTEPQL